MGESSRSLLDPHELHRSLWINIGSYVAQITLDPDGAQRERRVSDEVTSREEGETMQGGRHRETKGKGEPDLVMAGMEWMGRSGEEDKRWEVAKKRVAVWIKKYRYPLYSVC